MHMHFFVAIFVFLSSIRANASYLAATIKSALCQSNVTCRNGEPHFLCESQATRCDPFQLLRLDASQINYLLLGHNGIRNRVAGQYQIANMNIVQWSTELQLMAEMFLRKCRMERDSCQDVGPRELRVSENYLFYRGMVSKKWPRHLVRKWFNEFGYSQSWRNFHKRRLSKAVGNFSQMIYPLVKLIGCNGARLPTGYYVFVCYYWPRIRKKYEEGLRYGKPCSQCNPKIPACSRVFTGLCGIDIEISSAMRILKVDINKLVYGLLTLFLFNRHYLFTSFQR